ncbi:MAG: hypothetical protein M3451_06270, partial [Chloroflexota bacterium]|nr:hypothetical protein [Chloroflexota bacterium]
MPTRGHKGVRIRIGTPFALPETGPEGKRLTPEEATQMIMREIADLLPEDYRGIYTKSGSSIRGKS